MKKVPVIVKCLTWGCIYLTVADCQGTDQMLLRLEKIFSKIDLISRDMGRNVLVDKKPKLCKIARKGAGSSALYRFTIQKLFRTLYRDGQAVHLRGYQESEETDFPQAIILRMAFPPRDHQ